MVLSVAPIFYINSWLSYQITFEFANLKYTRRIKLAHTGMKMIYAFQFNLLKNID